MKGDLCNAPDVVLQRTAALSAKDYLLLQKFVHFLKAIDGLDGFLN